MGAKRYRHGLHGHLGILVTLMIVVLSLPEREVLAQTLKDTIIHVVAWGETVSSIAAKYGVAADDIVAHNHLAEVDRIYAGQQLIIPNVSRGVASENQWHGIHVVQPGENLYRISLKYGIDIQTLVSANGLTDEDHVFVGQTLIVPQVGDGATAEDGDVPAVGLAGNHIVQPGETLSGISQIYGVSVAALQTANTILNPSLIFAGQRLAIPGVASAANPGYAPQQTTVTHVVQEGENLFVIAAHYGVSMWVIAQSNNIGNSSLIYPGQLLSIPNSGALTSTDGTSGESGTSIVVDISAQKAYIYEVGALVQTFVVSTGLPGQDTRRGNFQIQNKIPLAYAATWDLQMPYWLGFYWAGPLQNGFHALPILSNGLRLWEGLLGRPASYGCVILSEEAAQWLYEWADIGTPVTIQD